MLGVAGLLASQLYYNYIKRKEAITRNGKRNNLRFNDFTPLIIGIVYLILDLGKFVKVNPSHRKLTNNISFLLENIVMAATIN